PVREPILVRIRMLTHREAVETGILDELGDLAETASPDPLRIVFHRAHRKHHIELQRHGLSLCQRSNSRAITTRCTSVAPSPRRLTRRSRYQRSSGSSSDKPSAPWIWMHRSRTLNAASVPYIFDTEASTL